jgi:hypothetical protein
MKYLVTKEKIGGVLFSCLLIAGAVGNSYAQKLHKKDNGVIIIDNFQGDTTGHLPYGWYKRDGEKKLINLSAEERSKFHYIIQQNHLNKYLHYEGTEAMHINFPLTNRKKENIYYLNVYQTPILSWKWRVFKLPQGADVEDNSRNDAAASIYVVWDLGHILFKKVPKTVRYVWGTSEPKGATFSKFFGNQKIIIVKSGAADEGKWITMQRNIVKDYEHLFGDKPPKFPLAILILSDGNNTNSRVEADYDDIKLKPSKSVGN